MSKKQVKDRDDDETTQDVALPSDMPQDTIDAHAEQDRRTALDKFEAEDDGDSKRKSKK